MLTNHENPQIAKAKNTPPLSRDRVAQKHGADADGWPFLELSAEMR